MSQDVQSAENGGKQAPLSYSYLIHKDNSK